ncbi:MAG: hypothetical protein SV765_08990 [Pseudomonadota bacterium]|nr:hypothetical protein [Pseudomonadota bacterium]
MTQYSDAGWPDHSGRERIAGGYSLLFPVAEIAENSIWGIEMAERLDGHDFNAISAYGVSETLVGLLQGLRETPGLSGFKFREEDISRLERSVIFRNYGKPCLELAYLLTAVMQLPAPGPRFSPVLQFFWVDQCLTPARVRAEFAKIATEPVSGQRYQLIVTEEGVQQNFGTNVFTISPSRVGFLAALLEFLVGVEPAILLEAEEALTEPDIRHIRSFASHIQKRLYDFLNEHLISAQIRRRFRWVVDWCVEQMPERKFLADMINDELVFRFWQEVSLEQDNLSFRRFRTVADDFIALLQALDWGYARQGVCQGAGIGSDVEAGEWHPDQLEQVDAEPGLERKDLSFLARAPKFFSSAVWVGLAQTLEDAGDICHRLPMTVMRMDVLGGLQAVFIQAHKDRQMGRVQHCLNGKPEKDYIDYKQQLARFAEVIADAKLLGLGLFLTLQHEEALSLLADLLPAESLVQMREAISGDSTEISVSVLRSIQLQIPAVNELCQQAQHKLRKTKRAGFDELPDKDNLVEYQYALEVIEDCLRLQSMLERRLYETTAGCETEQFETDLVAFRQTLRRHYGETL